jgi:hypothetical protein
MSHPGDRYCNCDQALVSREALSAANAALALNHPDDARRAIQWALAANEKMRLDFEDMRGMPMTIAPDQLKAGDVIRFPHNPLGSEERYRVTAVHDNGCLFDGNRFWVELVELWTGEPTDTHASGDAVVELMERGEVKP